MAVGISIACPPELIVTLVGVAVGLPLAVAASRLLRSMLFSVSLGDPISFVAALGRDGSDHTAGQRDTRAPRLVGRSDCRAAI